MKKILWIICGFIFPLVGNAQEHNWAFGLFGGLNVDDASYDASFGVQGKYDFSNRQSLQAQIYGRGDLLAVGADYLVHILDKEKSNFNVFLGAGLGQEFFTYDYSVDGSDDQQPIQRKENFTKANGQVGISYYFPAVDLSLYTAYVLKYQFKDGITEPNHLRLGLRYHIWECLFVINDHQSRGISLQGTRPIRILTPLFLNQIV